MQYFVEQGENRSDVLNKIRMKYGSKATIMNVKDIHKGGFLGFFRKTFVEATGYVSNEARKSGLQKNFEAEKKKILETAPVKKDPLAEIYNEVKDIKRQLGSGVLAKKDEPGIVDIKQVLSNNDFSFEYIDGIIERIRKELSIDDLESPEILSQTVTEWIADSMDIYEGQKNDSPQVFILVGPTGVGKTTTIAKLAAIHGLGVNGAPPKKVHMVTIDTYRIGAKQQVEKYAQIMGIPFSCVETYEDLHKVIARNQDVDMILVDTIGNSPRKSVRLAEMRDLLEACGNTAETHLAVSATTKTSDIREIMKQFEPFGYQSVILTKLDETSQIGNLISVLNERQKPLSYITNGQGVPQDIEFASKYRMLGYLKGLGINRNRLRKKYGENDIID